MPLSVPLMGDVTLTSMKSLCDVQRCQQDEAGDSGKVSFFQSRTKTTVFEDII
jgi:hypothetical protein